MMSIVTVLGAVAATLSIFDRIAAVKPGADTSKLSARMLAAVATIDTVSRRTIGRGAIITSGVDGTHRDGSKHYTGNAVDLRTNDLAVSTINVYARELDEALNGRGHRFDVLIASNHIHIEYDPKNYRMGVGRE